MPSFDILVVGSGGGPDETNLSAYLVKPHDTPWEDGIFALEAGSGQGALARLLHLDPQLLDMAGESRKYTASETHWVSLSRCFLITHAHLDHVNSLVISAGSLQGPRKRVYATKQTLQDLESIFSGRIWPNLASWNEEDENYKLLYTILCADNKYKPIHENVSVRTLPVSHGHNDLGNYESAAFFIRHDSTFREFLFFGDVEPDSVADRPQTLNVWRSAALKIPETLSTIFIECSWPSGRQDDTLYGHLTPEHLVDELVVLATEVFKVRTGVSSNSRSHPIRKRQRKNPVLADDLRGVLNGVRVFVTHCKAAVSGEFDQPSTEVIVSQIRALLEPKNLGVEVIIAAQGMRIEV